MCKLHGQKCDGGYVGGVQAFARFRYNYNGNSSPVAESKDRKCWYGGRRASEASELFEHPQGAPWTVRTPVGGTDEAKRRADEMIIQIARCAHNSSCGCSPFEHPQGQPRGIFELQNKIKK